MLTGYKSEHPKANYQLVDSLYENIVGSHTSTPTQTETLHKTEHKAGKGCWGLHWGRGAGDYNGGGVPGTSRFIHKISSRP